MTKFRKAMEKAPTTGADASAGPCIGRARASAQSVPGKATVDRFPQVIIRVGAPPRPAEHHAHLADMSPRPRRLGFQSDLSELSIEAAVRQSAQATLLGLRAQQLLIGVAERHPIEKASVEMSLLIENVCRGLGQGIRLLFAARAEDATRTNIGLSSSAAPQIDFV